MNTQSRNLLLAGLLASVALATLYFAVFGHPKKVDLGTYEALGAVTAEETARLLGDKGRVLVVARDTGVDKIPSVEAELQSFQRTLKQHKGVDPILERFEATPMQMMATGGSVPPDRLAQALAKHNDVHALVLFCGLPAVPESDMDDMRKRGIKIVVVSSFRPDYPQLLDQRLIHLAIVPKPEGPPPDAPSPRNWRERFDQEFAVLSASAAANPR
jgi:hypothetical protein